jgi:hypothetical protein
MDGGRQFHIGEFNPEVVYAQLSPQFAGHFFSKLLNSFSIQAISNYSNLPVKALNRIVRSYSESSKKQAFIKIENLLKLAELVNEIDLDRPILSLIERNIVALRGYGRSGVCYNPKIPVNENEYLVRIIVHLIGDGSIKREFGTNYRPSYTNGNRFLREQFVECLSQCFGNVTDCIYRYIDKSGHSRSYIAFSQWLSYVLQYLYPDARFDEENGSLPASFFQLPLKLKTEMVRTFGDDDGHVGAHSIRFTSGGATILEQMRRLIVELMESTLSPDEYEGLVSSVGEVKAFRSWFILDVYRPVFGWYAEHVGFSHPARAERLVFQLACDWVWGERGLDGFDLDFLTLVGLRRVGSVADVARRFLVREDFLFRVVERLRRLEWVRRVEKRQFTTVYQTTPKGEAVLERVWTRGWSLGDRVVMSQDWWSWLREALLERFGTAAAVARAVGMPETTVRGYLQGRRQWMDARGVVVLADAVGWTQEGVSEGVVVAFSRRLAPRYEQCVFLGKDLEIYRRFSVGAISFDTWLERRRVGVVRQEQLLDAAFAEKLQSASAIRERIVTLAKVRGGEIGLAELKADLELDILVANRYPAYLADRMAKLIQQGVFVRVVRGRYRLASPGL